MLRRCRRFASLELVIAFFTELRRHLARRRARTKRILQVRGGGSRGHELT